jgi:hypothetical protein
MYVYSMQYYFVYYRCEDTVTVIVFIVIQKSWLPYPSRRVKYTVAGSVRIRSIGSTSHSTDWLCSSILITVMYSFWVMIAGVHRPSFFLWWNVSKIVISNSIFKLFFFLVWRWVVTIRFVALDSFAFLIVWSWLIARSLSVPWNDVWGRPRITSSTLLRIWIRSTDSMSFDWLEAGPVTMRDARTIILELVKNSKLFWLVLY